MVLGAVALLGGELAHAADLADRSALESFVDGVVSAQMDSQHIPAAAVGIVSGGDVVLAKGYGYADREKRTPIDAGSSVLLLGSVAKLFVWTAVMQLVEAGRLDLDADVNRYLRGVFSVPATYPQPITLRHLMMHTAGFEEGGPSYVTEATLSGAESVRDSLARHMPRRVRPPGEVSSYSNYGVELAGFIVEQASGQPFALYAQRHIFGPLGMLHASMEERIPESLAAFRVKAYERANGVFVHAEDDLVGGLRLPGSATGTVIGMTHFMLAHLQEGEYSGVRILNAATAQAMHRVEFQGDTRLPGMTLGFYELRINGLRVIAHAGDTLHFHNLVYLVPEKGFGVFASYIGNNGHDAHEAFLQALFDRYFPEATLVPRGAGSVKDDPARYAGMYEAVRRYHTTVLKALAPAHTVRIDALENGRLSLIRAGEEPQQFVPLGNGLFQQLEGSRQIAFRLAADGRPSELLVDDQPFMTMEPMPWVDRPTLWGAGVGLAGLVLGCALIVRWIRRHRLKTLPASSRRVVLVGVSVAAWFFLTALTFWWVVGGNGRALYFADSGALELVLVMPLVFAALTIALLVVTVQDWIAVSCSPEQRAGHALILLAALFVCAAFVQWNLLGWQWA